MRRLGMVGIRGALSRAQMTAHHGGVEIVAACDTWKDRRQMAADLGIPVYEDYDEMLRRGRLDSIIIATPNHLHCDMTVKAFAAGLDVFVEKPMAVSLEECDRMIEAAEAAGRFLMVGLCYRHSNLYGEFVRAIREQVVGAPKMIWCKEFRGHWGRNRDAWRLSQALSGGSLLEKNCHHFDIWNWAIQSPPAYVQAFGGNAVHKESETLDHAIVNVEYANGVKGTLMLCLFLPSFDQLEIGALCEGGKVESLQLHGIENEADLIEEVPKVKCVAQELSVWPLPGFETKRTIEPHYCDLWPDGKYQHLGTARQFERLNACLTQGRKPEVDGVVGRESLLIAIAAEESIRQGGVRVEATR